MAAFALYDRVWPKALMFYFCASQKNQDHECIGK
jgi:hypothetical protein